MKKVIIGFCLSFLILNIYAQDKRVDTVAVMIIDRMASVVGDLASCSFTLKTSFDVTDQELGMVKHTGTSDVYMVGPDKMLVHSYGDKGHRGFWYNGAQFVYYSFDENNYAIVDAPPTIISTIDTINVNYGIEFPAADIFYPTLTDDILDQFDIIAFLGKTVLDGQECLQVMVSNSDISFQYWLSNDAFNLPLKFVIINKNEGNKQYEATFSNWQLNNDLPAAIFEFMPPPGAHEISIMPRTQK